MEVGDVHLSAASDGFVVNLLTDKVEELDISLLVVAKVHREFVGGRVRINSEVVLFDFRNIDDTAVVAGHAKADRGFRITHPEDIRLIDRIPSLGGNEVVSIVEKTGLIVG